MALVRSGLETTTRATCGRSTSATAQQLVVASRATWSVGWRNLPANSSSTRRSRANRSRQSTLPAASTKQASTTRLWTRSRPRPPACGHPAPQSVSWNRSWEFLPGRGKIGGHARAWARAAAEAWTTSPQGFRAGAETAATSSSSKLNRVGRKGAHLRRRARSPYAYSSSPEARVCVSPATLRPEPGILQENHRGPACQSPSFIPGTTASQPPLSRPAGEGPGVRALGTTTSSASKPLRTNRQGNLPSPGRLRGHPLPQGGRGEGTRHYNFVRQSAGSKGTRRQSFGRQCTATEGR